MSNKFRPNQFFVFFIIFAIFFFATLYFFVWHPRGVDKFFHFKIMQLYAHNFILKTVPQLDDIIWGRLFTDKQWAFHQILKYPYFAFGKSFIESLFVMTTFVFFLVVFYLERWKKNHLFYFLIFAIFVIFGPYLQLRLTLIRPHVYAFYLIYFLFYFKTKNSKISYFILLIFPLFYQVFYLPLIVCFWMDACRYLRGERNESLKSFLISILCLVIGIIAHPSFPGNFLVGILSSKIALNKINIPHLIRPKEFFPIKFSSFILFYHFPLLISLTGAALSFKKWSREKKIAPYAALSFICLTFLILCQINMRAQIYWLLFSSLLALHLGRAHLTQFKFLKKILVLQLIISFCIFIYASNRPKGYDWEKRFSYLEETIRPIKNLQAKVFNCNWTDGSYLFYSSDNLKLVDLSDPYLLFQEGFDLGYLKISLNFGVMKEPVKIIKEVFKSDFILCSNKTFNSKVKGVPRIENGDPENPFHLYDLRNYDP